MRQRLGILLNRVDWQKAKKNKGPEKISLYLDAARRYNVQLIFFGLEDICSATLTAAGYYRKNKRWFRTEMKLPKVIHNRAFYSEEGREKLTELEQAGITIYNSWNGYDKLYIDQLLQKNERLRTLLPLTLSFHPENVSFFMKRASFFLKPRQGSVGKGILKIEKLSSDSWQVLEQHKNKLRRRRKSAHHLYSCLADVVGEQEYILQETIPLLTLGRNPVDIRVSVQRNGAGSWQTTGMVAKVAHHNRGSYLSNVAQGGRVLPIERVLFSLIKQSSSGPAGRGTLESIKKEISDVGVELALYLSKQLPQLADLGFDLGLDQQGNIYFIEMNSRDQRYSFLLAGLNKIFRQTYANPLAYGAYLLASRAE